MPNESNDDGINETMKDSDSENNYVIISENVSPNPQPMLKLNVCIFDYHPKILQTCCTLPD